MQFSLLFALNIHFFIRLQAYTYCMSLVLVNLIHIIITYFVIVKIKYYNYVILNVEYELVYVKPVFDVIV